VVKYWLVWLAAAALASEAGAAPDPMPAEGKPVEAAAKPAQAARPDPKLDPKNLLSLTADPITGKADRIDGDEAKGVVAFTFDDGPNPETTPHVIDALEKYNIPATFFIVTSRLTDHGKLLLHRELDEGFTVGSHTVTHANLKKATAEKLDKEVDGSLRTLAIEANRPIGMLRPPYGSVNPAVRAKLRRLNLTEVEWSVDTLDWKAHNDEKLRHKVVNMIKHDGGGVVLMHDVKPITARVIPEILDDLEAENCARLADHKDPIVPVSLHYFLKDGKTPRELPEAVKQRTAAYKAALPDRCAKRPPPAAEPATSHATE
jgi:peptidoglycan/xylan/chitin deacetylase (PgdA/CDA1 family)